MKTLSLATLAVALIVVAGCKSDPSGPSAAQIELQKQQIALQTLQIQQQQAAAAAQREQERQKAQEFANYKAAITSVIKQQQDAIENNKTIPGRIDGLRQIDTSECPPDFRTAFVDYISDLEQVNQIDVMRARLASDDNVSSVLITQIGQILTQSKESSFNDAMTADQKLATAREQWIQQGNEADRALARVAALYGVQY